MNREALSLLMRAVQSGEVLPEDACDRLKDLPFEDLGYAKVEPDIKRADAKLGNADFIARAPEEVVEGEREKREEAQARRQKIVEALERLRGAT